MNIILYKINFNKIFKAIFTVFEIPENHPRAQSLKIRHKIIDGMLKLIVAEAGLIAHGRGEAFDYLIGEKTNSNAINAMKAAVATLLLAKYPVISVNGNVTALCAKDIIEFSRIIGAKVEINIFYNKPGRLEAITKVFNEMGLKEIFGTNDSEKVTIKELSSNRRFVDPKGIKIADVVLVPLEDGDRTEALIKENKKVISIDLNPLSRTSQMAHISIVDNIIRAIPLMIKIAIEFKEKNYSETKLRKIVDKFNNKKNLSNAIKYIIKYLKKMSKLK